MDQGLGPPERPGQGERDSRRWQPERVAGQGHRHRHRLRTLAAAGRDHRQSAHPRFHRRLVAARSAQAFGSDRCRGDRPGAGLGLAPPGQRSHGGGVPGSHLSWPRRGNRQDPAALAGQAGHGLPARHPGQRRHGRCQGRGAQPGALGRRRCRTVASRLRAGCHRSSTLHRRPWPGNGRHHCGQTRHAR
ncbi:hypothetical protein D9M68_771370 [compost metagenome]